MPVLHTAVYHFPPGINTHFTPSMGRQRMSRAPGGHSSHGSSAVISQYSGNIRHSYPIIIAVSTLSGKHIPGIGRQLRSSGRCIALTHIRIFSQRIKTLLQTISLPGSRILILHHKIYCHLYFIWRISGAGFIYIIISILSNFSKVWISYRNIYFHKKLPLYFFTIIS